MSIQIRIDEDVEPLLGELTSPNGMGKLFSGLLRAAAERKRMIAAGQPAPYDLLTRVIIEEEERRQRSLKRQSDQQSQ